MNGNDNSKLQLFMIIFMILFVAVLIDIYSLRVRITTLEKQVNEIVHVTPTPR